MGRMMGWDGMGWDGLKMEGVGSGDGMEMVGGETRLEVLEKKRFGDQGKGGRNALTMRSCD